MSIFSAILSTCMGILVSVLTAIITHKLKTWDQANTRYRKEREQKEAAEAEKQRLRNEANDQLTLGMARTMLLQNYYQAVQRGYYPVTDRDVYHALYAAYRQAGGNSVIVQLAEKIVRLPTEPPTNKE